MGRKHPARAPVDAARTLLSSIRAKADITPGLPDFQPLSDALPCARECRLAAISVGDAHATTYKQIV
jgi:hypothetical protein